MHIASVILFSFSMFCFVLFAFKICLISFGIFHYFVVLFSEKKTNEKLIHEMINRFLVENKYRNGFLDIRKWFADIGNFLIYQNNVTSSLRQNDVVCT